MNQSSQTILNKENNKKDEGSSTSLNAANPKVVLKPREFGRDVTNSANPSNNSKVPNYTMECDRSTNA